MRSGLLLVSLLARSAFGAIFITSPTGGSNGVGGQNLTIQWNESPDPPTLAQIGPCEVGLYAGSQTQQTELQPIISSVDVSKVNTLSFTIQPNIGPNANAYFVRFTSLGLPAPDQPQFKYQSFSAKFSLSGMSGQFSPLVEAQISGSSVVSSSTSVGLSSSASSGPTTSSSPVRSTPSSGPTSATNTASGATASNTGAAVVTRGNMGVIGFVAALVCLML